MTKKPKGMKYRNLHARSGVIYYEREAAGERVKRTMGTDDWDKAAARRDLYLRQREDAPAPDPNPVPTFAILAARYLREAARHLAGSTREDRERMLSPDGLLVKHFGAMRADEVSRATLLDWWHREIEGEGRSENTGKQYLAALAGVFGHAVDLEALEINPVDALRGTLRRRRKTKEGRAASEGGKHIRPIETPADLRAFVAASRAAYDALDATGRPVRARQMGHVADLLGLDAGLREGESVGLRWRDVSLGEGPDDVMRSLAICETIARGKHEGPPKSGRTRVVALSRRLRALLREFYIASGRPAKASRVLPGLTPYLYATLHFEAVIAAAGIERHTPKDLRDTFASQLLTAGIQLGYISKQLGHSGVATTADHYARWAGGEAYRQPLDVAAGEVPADLLARIETIDSHQNSHHGDVAEQS
jgi:integrase